MKIPTVSPAVKLGLTFALTFLLAILADKYFPVFVDTPRWIVLGVYGYIGVYAIISFAPLLIWKSAGILTPFDGWFSVNKLQVIPFKSRKLCIVVAKGYNVPGIAINRPPYAWIIVPSKLLQRVGANLVIHARLYLLKHDFKEDYPELHTALTNAGYTGKTNHELWLAGLSTLRADRMFTEFDVRAWSEGVQKMGDEIKVLAKESQTEISRRLRFLGGKR